MLTGIQQLFLSVRKMGLKQHLTAFRPLKLNNTEVWRGNTLFNNYYINLIYLVYYVDNFIVLDDFDFFHSLLFLFIVQCAGLTNVK